MVMKKHRVALLVGGLAALAAASPAFATSLIQMTFEDLVADSAVVVVGEAADSRVEQTEAGVVTVTTFKVEEAMVGEPGAIVEVTTPGGVYTTNGVMVSETAAGTPIFLVGAEALLFLEEGAAGAKQIVGYNQGAVGVFNTPRGKSVRLPGAKGAETIAEAGARIRKEKSSPSRKLD